MAKYNSDGSIILTTSIDTTGIDSGINEITKKANATFFKAKEKIGVLSNETQRLGKAIAAAFSVKAIIQFNKQSSVLELQTEASAQRIIGIYGSASDVVGNFIDNNARALSMAKSDAAVFAATYGNIFNTFANQKTNANMTIDYLRMTAVVASKTGRTMQDVQDRIRSGLLGNTEAIEDLGVFVNVSTIEMTNAFKKYANGKTWAQLDARMQNQIRALAILEQSTKQYGNDIENTKAIAITSLKSVWTEFKSTYGKIVNDILIPFVKKLTIIIESATSLLKTAINDTGGILSNIEGAADSSSKIVENQEDLNNELKQTESLTKRILAGFDDIQKLGGEKQSDASNITDFDYISSSKTENDNEYSQKIESVKGILQSVINWLPEAFMVIGLMLLGFGHIGWGISLLIAGAEFYQIHERNNQETDLTSKINPLKQFIENNIAKILIGSGILLLAFGHIGIGIATIIAGLNYDDIKETITDDSKPLEKKFDDIMSLLRPIIMETGLIMIVVGLIAFCAGQMNGIGFIVAGAGIVALEYTINQQAAETWLKSHAPDIAAIGGMVLLVAGLIAMFAGNLMSGSIMVAMGAGGIIWTYKNNEGSDIATWLKSKINEYKDIFGAIGGLAALIGIILILNSQYSLGAAILSGGIASLGIAGIAREAQTNSDIEKLNQYYSIVGEPTSFKKDRDIHNIQAIGFDEWFKNETGESFESWYIKQMADKQEKDNEFKTNNPELVEKLDELNRLIQSGVSKEVIDIKMQEFFDKTSKNKLPESFITANIPKYATGTVIPPNHEFLAVLGDQKRGINVETPLTTMIDAFNKALDNRSNANNQPVHIHLSLDGKEIYETVVEQNKKNTRMTGVNEFAY